ncbi:ribonuclease J [Aliibacillus thermotolerans]|uniref:Ribonuclease J n=1 Tax=Aliibacillus thermotolerans TaxID=1834418 RepID=A0ABW0U5S2_9BACI
MVNDTKEVVRVFSLGGVGEIGKNMYVIELDEDILVLDAGLIFPEEDMLGVDIVIPDISYLVQNKDRIRGIVLTHGHEDHIGALPYIFKKLNPPIYGTKLTLGLVEEQLKEKKVKQKADLRVIHENTTLKAGKLEVRFFSTAHSIPGSLGVSIHTSQGAIVYTGDFKLDQMPVDGVFTDIETLTRLGREGVLCLLSDSTNAEVPGYTPSETVAGQGIREVFQEAEGRLIVTTFASNIHRIQQVLDASLEQGRKVVISEKSLQKIVHIARQLGHLHCDDDLLIPIDKVDQLKDDEITILCTGSQGEPMSVLALMAKGAHRHISIRPNDTVIIAANPAPGNEKTIAKTIDHLYQAGADVIYGDKNIHVSGHASQEELLFMLNLLKPKYFIPVHGEYRMQFAHGELAEKTGVLREHIFLLDKGDCVEFVDGQGKRSGKVPAGNVLIDGLGIGDVGNIVLRDRRLLSEDGILVVVVTLNKKNGAIASGPDIISRGFVYVRESEKLLQEANDKVTATLKECMSENVNEWSTLKSNIRDVLSRYLYEKTKRRPMILPIIMEV